MCGIAGVLIWQGIPAERAQTAVNNMVHRLGHRGPDGHGVVTSVSTREASSTTAVLGHTRLSIIDLSTRGAQPMTSVDGQTVLTFNGEIYNFAELRHLLEDKGRRFQSDSDTEVILQGYEEWGDGVAERLRGMFAFAIWDGRRDRLVLVRDRLGIKPIYVYRADGWLAFASEIRALLATGLVPAKLDRVSVDEYLTYQTVPSPRTLVDGVRMQAPGSVVAVGARGETTSRRYWQLMPDQPPVVASDAGAASVRVHELLMESAALHMVSDVPVGLFLSGGIDSSALVALVRQCGIVPRTFAVAFPGTSFDESPYARAVARALGSDHIEIPLSEDDLLAQLPDALDGVDHPSGDGINTYVVSRAVRQAGIKVALSGLGGDEFFGGYPSFQRLRQIGRYAGIWGRTPAAVRALMGRIVRVGGGRRVSTEKTAALVATDASFARAFPVLRQLFVRRQRIELLGEDLIRCSDARGDAYVELLEQAEQHREVGHLMALVSYGEARMYMHDVLLRDTDQMSMRPGLEVRVPLLDHKLVEMLMRLPDGVKNAGAGPKPLLLASLGVRLPDECVHRPKRGFVLPFEYWMRGALRPFCERHLRQLGTRELFEPEAVDALWRAFEARRPSTSWARPWALVALDAWLERNGIAV